MALLKTIMIDRENVDIDSLSDTVLVDQLHRSEASCVASALDLSDVDKWTGVARRVVELAKLAALVREARRRKLVTL